MANQTNLRRLAETSLESIARFPGWDAFLANVGACAQYTSTPGWEDQDTRRTVPGAKPIGMAQWHSAIEAAIEIVEAVPNAGWPEPGACQNGDIWLRWVVSDNAELRLELSANLLAETYSWTSMRDGNLSQHTSSEPRDIIEAMRAVLVGARKNVAA